MLAGGSGGVPLSARVAIVTGGSGGMGPAIGLALARRGVGHIVFAQRGDASAAVAAAERAGASARGLALDVSSRAGVLAFFAAFDAAHARLDMLVNCAGVAPRSAVADVDEEEMAAALAVNVTGPFWMCQAARPRMFASGGGAVVNIGSLAGEDGANAASPAYSIAKGGLRAMMMHLAKAGFPPGVGADARAGQPLIRVNNVSPGPVDTVMLASMSAADLAKITAATLTGRVTTVDEVAAATAYLLLDAHNTTGQTLQINGGVTRT